MSYLLWIGYSIVVFLFWGQTVYEITKAVMPHGSAALVVGIVCGSYLIPVIFWKLASLILVFMQNHIFSRKQNRLKVFEAISLILLTALYVVRAWLYSEQGQLLGEVSFEGFYVQKDQKPEGIIQGGTEVYQMMLRGVFLLMGNYGSAAVVFQALLLALSVMMNYGLIRRIGGRAAALSVICLLVLSSTYRNIIFVFSPELFLYFLCSGFALLYVMGAERDESGKKPFSKGNVFIFMSGCLLGSACCLHITGFIVAVFSVGLILGLGLHRGRINVTGLLALLTGMLLIVGAEGMRTGILLPGWSASCHMTPGIPEVYIDDSIIIVMVLQVLAAGIALNIKRAGDVRTLGAAFGVLCTGLLIPGLGLWNPDMGLWSYFSWSAAGAFAICFRRDILEKETLLTDKGLQGDKALGGPSLSLNNTGGIVRSWEPKMFKEMNDQKGKQDNNSGDDSTSRYDSSKGTRYIPNPLPLPKKTKKKEMGYALDIQEELTNYDIEVSEQDDFDL